MDKSKIIDEILMEWAMRSPDGLVGGHDTPENMAALNELLNEYGLSELDIGDWGVGAKDEAPDEGDEVKPIKLKKPQSKFQKKDKATGKTIVVGHPNYKDGTFLDDIIANKQGIWFTPAEKAKLELSDEERKARIEKDIWDDMSAPNGKAVGENYITPIRNAIKKAGVTDYAESIYNRCTLSDALKIYNTNSGNQKSFVDAMNSVKHQGLGRGEMAFVFMLKEVKSGGIGDVDLINVEGYGKMEVKEVGANKGKEKVRISSSTLEGFSRSEFKNAIEDLAYEVRKNKQFGDFLLKVLSGKTPDGKQYLYPHPRTPTEEEIAMLTNFVKDPKTADMPKNLFRALVIISVKLELPSKPTDVPAKVAVDVGGSKEEFGTDPVQASQELKKVSINKAGKITLDVNPIVGDSDSEYKNIAIKLKFFDKKYNLKTISEEIGNLVSKKYTGMLIVSGGKDSESSDTRNKAVVINTDKIELEFDSMAQNGIVCNVKTDLANLKGMDL